MFQDFENNIINFFNDLINYDTHCCSNEALSFITCTMSAKRLSGKRKLSAVEAENVDHPPTMATRRTRSSSVAENCNTQRSTRSANKNSFVQLPHNYRYSSRKVVQGMSVIVLRFVNITDCLYCQTWKLCGITQHYFHHHSVIYSNVNANGVMITIVCIQFRVWKRIGSLSVHADTSW